MTQQMTKRLAQTLQGFDFLDRQPEKNLVCWVGLLLLLLMQTLALAEETADFDQYDPDVAALLKEYRAESDESGKPVTLGFGLPWAKQGRNPHRL